MAVRIITWDDEKTKNEVLKRFKHASNSRVYQEDRWIRNERTIYATNTTQNMSYLQTSLESNFNIGLPGVDGSNADLNISYAFKNFRFIHAQMSANPPSVVMRPNNSDQENHRKADAADRVVRWSIRHYNMQEAVDQASLNTLLYGTGVAKTVWDSTKGSIVDFDEKTGEVTLEGDIDISIPFMWNVFLDPDGKNTQEVKYVFERIYLDYDEACARWPDKADVLKAARVEHLDMQGRERASQLQNDRYNVVELLEYWEKGLPTNGYLGRYCITTVGGDIIEPVRANPFRFKQAGSVYAIEQMDVPDDVKERLIAKLPEMAALPYRILTDIDIPNMVWGRSFVEYVASLQENLNKMNSAELDNMEAHGVARLVVPESADVADQLSNSPWDITKISGNQPPYFMQPPQLMPAITENKQYYAQGINDMSGTNDSMFGQQQRETSGATMQYATNNGNMVRRRLFNKYVLFVEGIYKDILKLVTKHWTTSRTIHVLGKENALEAVDLKGTDIDGGYDVVGEYGVSLSLDPMTRREEILTLQPLFEKAGVPTRTTLKLLKLNELEGMYDKLELAEIRQKEIFDEIVASGRYIQPEELLDHQNMIAYALDWFMTSEFTYLPEPTKLLCRQHIKDRIQLAAQEQAGGAAGGSPQAPGALPPSPPGPVPSQPAGPVPAPAGLPPITNG